MLQMVKKQTSETAGEYLPWDHLERMHSVDGPPNEQENEEALVLKEFMALVAPGLEACKWRFFAYAA
jgi:hypothetical protein